MPNPIFMVVYNNLIVFKGPREDCISRRAVAGDLLFDEDGKIDQYEDWLFQWEREDPTCYARWSQAQKKRLPQGTHE